MPSRKYEMTIEGAPAHGPSGKNAYVANTEIVTAELGQAGTQFDGPGHIGVNTPKGSLFYNGRLLRDAYEHSIESAPGSENLGVGRWGVEHIGELVFVCRLVVLDAVAYRKQQGTIPLKADRLPPPADSTSPGIVTADDVKGIMKIERLKDLQPGDCVALHTGHGNLWSNDKFMSMTSEQRAEVRAIESKGFPGFGLSACEYLASRYRPANGRHSSVEASIDGSEQNGNAIPCHVEEQTRAASGNWSTWTQNP